MIDEETRQIQSQAQTEKDFGYQKIMTMIIECVEDYTKTNDKEVPMVEVRESNSIVVMFVREVYVRDWPCECKHLDVD